MKRILTLLAAALTATLLACSSDEPAGPETPAAPDTTRLIVTLDYQGAYAVTDSTPVHWGVSTSVETLDYASGGSFVQNATTGEITLESLLGEFAGGTGTIYLAAFLDATGTSGSGTSAAGSPITVHDRVDPFSTDLATLADGIRFDTGDVVRVTLTFGDVYIVPAEPSVFAVSESLLVLCAHGSASLTVEALDPDGVPYAQAPTWHSTDLAVAAVDDAGRVAALQPGEAGVYATLPGAVSDTCLVRVQDCVPDRIGIIAGETNPCLGDTTTFVADVLNLAGESLALDVVWNSSDPSVATIDESGQLSALQAGETELTAAVDGLESDPLTVTVVDCELAGIRIVAWEPEVCIDGTVTFTAEAYDQDEQPLSRPVVWSSSDLSAATVDSMGRVTGVDIGSCRIFATVPVAGFDGEAYVDIDVVGCGPYPVLTAGSFDGWGLNIMDEPRVFAITDRYQTLALMPIDLDGDGNEDLELRLVNQMSLVTTKWAFVVVPARATTFVAIDPSYVAVVDSMSVEYQHDGLCDAPIGPLYASRWARGLLAGEAIADEHDWANEQATLYYYYYNQDCSERVNEQVSLEAGLWPFNETRYLAVRMEVDGGNVYGWISCRYNEAYNYPRVVAEAWVSESIPH